MQIIVCNYIVICTSKVRPERDSNPQSSDSNSETLSARLCTLGRESTLKMSVSFFGYLKITYLGL